MLIQLHLGKILKCHNNRLRLIPKLEAAVAI